jgi:hypothetical protein
MQLGALEIVVLLVFRRPTALLSPETLAVKAAHSFCSSLSMLYSRPLNGKAALSLVNKKEILPWPEEGHDRRHHDISSLMSYQLSGYPALGCGG